MARAEKKAERREQILEGMFEAMARGGTAGSSVSEIAAAAGIARGALHYYFESKEEIRLRLMERLGQRYTDGLNAYLDEFEHDGEAMVGALLRYHFAGASERAEQLLGVWIDFWGHAPSEPGLRDVVLEVQERARRACWRAIVACRPDQGDLDDEQARLVAASLLAVIEGGLLQWRIALHSDLELDARALGKSLERAALALVRALPSPSRVPSAPAPETSLGAP